MNRTDRVLHNPDRSCATYTPVAANLDDVTSLVLESAIWMICMKPGRKSRRAFSFAAPALDNRLRLRRVEK